MPEARLTPAEDLIASPQPLAYSLQPACCRLFVDPPADGPWNMAVDETLLGAAAQSGICSLRFYRWREPTLSLGYFQRLADRSRHPASNGCAVVRRVTGGGAILHDAELTYSLALPTAHPLARNPQSLYDTTHLALAEVLATLGILARLRTGAPIVSPPQESFLCFQRASVADVLVGEAKICGSAQRRHRGAVLQHGSVLLESSLLAAELPGLTELTGRRIPDPLLVEFLSTNLAERLAIELSTGQLTSDELENVRLLAREKYSSIAWTNRR